MAIDTWVTAQVDPNAALKPDRSDHVHIVKRNTAPANDFTLSFDKTKVASVNVLRSLIDQALKSVVGGRELT